VSAVLARNASGSIVVVDHTSDNTPEEELVSSLRLSGAAGHRFPARRPNSTTLPIASPLIIVPGATPTADLIRGPAEPTVDIGRNVHSGSRAVVFSTLSSS
jgi:hypothetical protein